MDRLNTKSLFKKVVFIIILTTFICVTFIIAIWFYFQESYIKETNETHSKQMLKAIDFTLGSTLEDAKSNIVGLINSTVFIERLKLRDREGLEEILKPNFEVMQQKDKFLNLLQIDLSEKPSFVSLQEPKVAPKNRAINRVMLKEVHTLHHEIYGYVQEGNQISYRIIMPIFDTQKEYLGAIEIGWSADFILDMVKQISGFEGLIFIQNRALSASDKSQQYSIDDYQLYSQPTKENLAIFKALHSYGHIEEGSKIEYNEDKYSVHFVNLKNHSNQTVLRVVFLDNKSEHNLFSTYSLLLLVTLFILTFAILLPLIYRAISKYQDSMRDLFNKKINEMKLVKDELKFNRKYFKNIFDAVPNIIVITDGHTMVNANPAMLDFLHYESIEAFKSEHNCICDLFLGGSEYLQPDKDGVSWIEQIKADPLAHHEVLISRDGVQHIFNIRLKSFKLDKNPMYIIVLTDITELEESRAQFELAINGTNDGLWDWNIESNQLFFSKKWKAMLGYSEDEIGNDFSEWSSRTHPDDLKFVNDAIRISHKNDTPYKTTFRMKHNET